MPVDFKGHNTTVVIPGDRGHTFRLPDNRDTMPAKTSTALAKLIEARAAEQNVKANASKAAKQEAMDAMTSALNDLYDTAAATSASSKRHHEEGYSYAAAKLNRALTDAQTALQALADHAGQYANPSGVGLPDRNTSKAVTQLRLIAGALDQLPAVPAIDA